MQNNPSSTGRILRLALCSAVLLSAALLAVAPRIIRSLEVEPARTPLQLTGDAARKYLTQPGEGQSLMAATIDAMFGLQRQEHPPSGEPGGAGYLAMSHDQNLQAWFGTGGMSLRPTVPDEKRAEAWQMDMQLKAIGYGALLAAAPPIVATDVKGTRIEYQRRSDASSVPQSEIRIPQLVEWYENRPEGLEHGFTLTERPHCADDVGEGEPLRVVLAVSGGLRAELKDEDNIVLSRSNGTAVLSYRKLIAEDADGRRLASRMRASADGSEIALVVDDRQARYPIVIDPIMTSLEAELDASGAGAPNEAQAEARFGFAVALEGDRATVGAWRHDYNYLGTAEPDSGAIYNFIRSGSAWQLSSSSSGYGPSAQCGYSVAISGAQKAFGCPGQDGKGGAYFQNFNGTRVKLEPFGASIRPGDQFGTSVALSNGNVVIVGAPGYDHANKNDSGAAHIFRLNFNAAILYKNIFAAGGAASEAFGGAVAIDPNWVVVGAAGGSVGYARVFTVGTMGDPVAAATLLATSGSANDGFGNSVDVSDDTLVVGAQGDDEKATDAGAAYVYVRGGDGTWAMQQKLTASNGRAGDFFSSHAVAIEGNSIVVGAHTYDAFGNPNDNSGSAYLFTRNQTVWTEQAQFYGANNPDDQFGIGVDISRDTVLVGARAGYRAAGGSERTGAAWVYRLGCVPPYASYAAITDGEGSFPSYQSTYTACPGTFVRIRLIEGESRGGATFQWRKNGTNIAGATGEEIVIENASASDAGNYEVIVSNACGADVSSVAKLSVAAFSLNATSQNFGVAGSNGIVNVSSTGSCAYTATSNAPWIKITSGGSGTAPGTVGFTVDPMNESDQRTGTITIGDRLFTITQDGLNCAYSISPTEQSVGANGGGSSVNVTVTAGCSWSAASNAPFITINSAASGTGSGALNYSVAPNHSTAERSGTLTVAGQTLTVRQAPAALLGNISTRLRVEQGDNALIGGFIITGTQPKRLMLRAIGPSLPVEGALGDPQLQIFNSGGEEIAFNNNWRDASNRQEIIDSTIAPSSDFESAILRELAPGAYTAVVRGVDDTTGVGLIEAYDLGQGVDAKLANISTRGLVQTGSNVMIGGFFVLGGPQKVILRAIGPSLDVNGRLEDPLLELFNGNGDGVASNNNWRDTQQSEIETTTIPPPNDLESAIVQTLAPGPYTAVVRGVNDTTGVALVEVYALD